MLRAVVGSAQVSYEIVAQKQSKQQQHNEDKALSTFLSVVN